jgi:hypothetical protein
MIHIKGKWLLKAALQKAMSAAPHGEALNYAFQRRVTRSLPRSREALAEKFSAALAHYQAAVQYGDLPGPPRTAYEFGAGWDLAVPLSLYMLGVESQTLVDLRPLVRWGLVNHALDSLREATPRLAARAGRELRPPPPGRLQSRAELARATGIRYLAPRDARDTGLAAGGFALVSSTQTLEHIPGRDLPPILKECRRLTAPGGIASLTVDMQDHYSYFDPALGPHHFLGINDGAWRLVNSGLHFQNRLRLPDYLRAVRAAGLRIAEQRVEWASPGELERLSRMKLAARFRGACSLEELGAKGVHLICRPAGAKP